MKITKRQLKRIIKEEKRRLVSEGVQRFEEALFTALDEYVTALDEDMGYNVPPEEIKAEVLNFIDGFFEDTEYAAGEHAREEQIGRR